MKKAEKHSLKTKNKNTPKNPQILTTFSVLNTSAAVCRFAQHLCNRKNKDGHRKGKTNEKEKKRL